VYSHILNRRPVSFVVSTFEAVSQRRLIFCKIEMSLMEILKSALVIKSHWKKVLLK
jgi:hypothetical protein